MKWLKKILGSALYLIEKYGTIAAVLLFMPLLHLSGSIAFYVAKVMGDSLASSIPSFDSVNNLAKITAFACLCAFVVVILWRNWLVLFGRGLLVFLPQGKAKESYKQLLKYGI